MPFSVLLGAFGCCAFENDPEVVARAYKTALQEFPKVFKQIKFAVYCPPIADNLAGPITNTAAKTYVRKYDPSKPTFQLIFHELWKHLLIAAREKGILIQQYILYEVARIIAWEPFQWDLKSMNAQIAIGIASSAIPAKAGSALPAVPK